MSEDVPSEGQQRALGLLRSDRTFLTACSGIILSLIVLNLVRMSWKGEPTFEVVHSSGSTIPFLIDVNSASWVEWMQLAEIGETTARQIVTDRAENGPFQSIEDVQRVKGIGPVTMDKIRPFLKAGKSEEVQGSGD